MDDENCSGFLNHVLLVGSLQETRTIRPEVAFMFLIFIFVSVVNLKSFFFFNQATMLLGPLPTELVT